MNQKEIEILHYKNKLVPAINRLMYEKSWSIKQLSEEADLPYESVKKIIGGKVNNPTIYSLIKICKALDCSIDFIIE